MVLYIKSSSKIPYLQTKTDLKLRRSDLSVVCYEQDS